MFKATKRHLYIKSVKILLPAPGVNKWKKQSEASDTDLYIEKDSLFKVVSQDGDSIIYPKTEGFRTNCRDLGSHIQLTNKFTIDHLDDSSKEYYSTLFVKLWALLRFGVFEETGELTDKKYPLWYVDTSIKNENDEVTPIWLPNVCTTRDLLTTIKPK